MPGMRGCFQGRSFTLYLRDPSLAIIWATGINHAILKEPESQALLLPVDVANHGSHRSDHPGIPLLLSFAQGTLDIPSDGLRDASIEESIFLPYDRTPMLVADGHFQLA